MDMCIWDIDFHQGTILGKDASYGYVHDIFLSLDLILTTVMTKNINGVLEEITHDIYLNVTNWWDCS